MNNLSKEYHLEEEESGIITETKEEMLIKASSKDKRFKVRLEGGKYRGD